MIRLRRIVCPVDFSELSRRALEHAAVLARWYGAELVALHVAPLVPSVFPLPPGTSTGTLEPFDVDAMARELKGFAEGAFETMPGLQMMVRSGAAAPVILDLAREIKSDLLVLGTHGRTGFERFMLGSVTEKVVRKAPCPVLTVPRGAEGRPERPVFQRVLCGLDFSEASRRALEYALSLAEEANGRLTLLHTVEWLPMDSRPAHLHFDVDLYRQSLLTAARARLDALVPAEARDWCQVDTRTGCGKPYVEILAAAVAERADLIVLGVHGGRPIDRMLFGSTTQQVVRQAQCPVLTVRD